MYEPEVIIGAHRLNDFGVPIIAYAVNVLTAPLRSVDLSSRSAESSREPWMR